MNRKRKNKNKKASDALAGLSLIVIVFIWLITGDTSLAISLFIVLIVILLVFGILLYIKRNKMKLVSGIEEINKKSQVKRKEMTEKRNNEYRKVNSSNICPHCGSNLVVKNGKRGKFIGCTGFPKCWYSRDY